MACEKIYTVGDLKEMLADLDDEDQVCIETIDLETGDTEDLYPFHIDIIDGIELTDGTIVREVRFCQENNINKLSTEERNRMIEIINEIVNNHGSFDFNDAEYQQGITFSAKSRYDFQQIEYFDEDECTLVTYINNKIVKSEQIDYNDLDDEKLISVLNIAEAFNSLQ